MFQRVPQIEITTPYKTVKMDLKKIMALAMLALMVIPSLTIVVRADEPTGEPDDGAGLAGAIERARLYLDKVRASAENLATKYEDNEDVLGYLNKIYELLDQGEVETHEILLKTTGAAGDEDRIVIPMPEGFTLGQLKKISWSVRTLSGYPPHVDIILADDIDGLTNIDSLTAELAENVVGYTPIPTGQTYGTWLKTFEGFTNGPNKIDDSTVLWVTRHGAGCKDAPYGTLEELKVGTVHYPEEGDPEITIDKDVVVLRLELEVDYWPDRDGDGVDSEAYVDDIKINGVLYDFEEEPEDLGAEGFLDQALVYLGEGDNKSAAKSLASARDILGRVKGLLTSMIKIDKVARTDWFIRQFEHRIEGLEDKIGRLRGRFGGGNANRATAAMGWARGRLGQLGGDLSASNVDVTLDGLCDIIASINIAIDDLGGDPSDILEAIYRLEAKIQVLNASSVRLAKKGMITSDIDAELSDVELLLNKAVVLLEEGNTVDAEALLGQAEDLVREAGSTIQGISKVHTGKGPKPK